MLWVAVSTVHAVAQPCAALCFPIIRQCWDWLHPLLLLTSPSNHACGMHTGRRSVCHPEWLLMSFHCLLPKSGGHTDRGFPPICTLWITMLQYLSMVRYLSMMQYGVPWCNSNNGVHVEVHYGVIRRSMMWYSIRVYMYGRALQTSLHLVTVQYMRRAMYCMWIDYTT